MSYGPQLQVKKETGSQGDVQKPAIAPTSSKSGLVDVLGKLFDKNPQNLSLVDQVNGIREAQKAAALKTLQEGDAFAKENNWRGAAGKYSDVGSKFELNAYADSEKDSVVIIALRKLADLLREQNIKGAEKAEKFANVGLKKELEAFNSGMGYVHAAAQASTPESKAQCNETALNYFRTALHYNPASSRSKLKIAQITAHTEGHVSALEQVDALLKEDPSCAEAIAYKAMLLGGELNDKNGEEVAKRSLLDLYNANCNLLKKAKPLG